MVGRLIRRSPKLYGAWRAIRNTIRTWAPLSTRLTPRRLRRHALAAREINPSFAGEAEHLDAVLRTCGITSGFVVDMAAGDGVRQSCTLHLFRDPNWKGLAVEMDPIRFRLLAHAYAQFEGASVAQARITPDSVEALLRSRGVPREFDVLNLDIDSYDLAVAEAMLATFRPAVITMEVNEKVPPPVYFAVTYEPTHYWQQDHFFGCSLVAAAEGIRPFGYVLESLHYNNAFFIRRDVADGRFADMSVEDAYERGYRGRPDRRELFPWNHDVEHWLTLPPASVVEDMKTRFRAYEGRFMVEVRNIPEPDRGRAS